MLEVAFITDENEGDSVDFFNAEDLLADEREFGEGVEAGY